MPNISTDNKAIKKLLGEAKIIAVVGLSPEPDKPSHEVAQYLQSQGYKIVPVRPGADEILGEKVYASLKDIPFKVDIVDVFRKPEHMHQVVDEALAIRPKAVWMQLGISNEAAATKASQAGLQVVEDRCILIEHKKNF
ncbi:MAG TPA: CoA-binding protein [Bdellovibrionota bacterium]|nr:CoA-binding protein [Bdellovibrionota bacterium]